MLKNINPKYWGKNFWIVLNSIALTYDSKNKKEYLNFFKSIQYVLPCDKCKVNYSNHLKNINLDSSDTLLEWLIRVRNDIYITQKRNIVQTKESSINEIFKRDDKLYFVIIVIIILCFVFIKIEKKHV